MLVWCTSPDNITQGVLSKVDTSRVRTYGKKKPQALQRHHGTTDRCRFSCCGGACWLASSSAYSKMRVRDRVVRNHTFLPSPVGPSTLKVLPRGTESCRLRHVTACRIKGCMVAYIGAFDVLHVPATQTISPCVRHPIRLILALSQHPIHILANNRECLTRRRIL